MILNQHDFFRRCFPKTAPHRMWPVLLVGRCCKPKSRKLFEAPAVGTARFSGQNMCFAIARLLSYTKQHAARQPHVLFCTEGSLMRELSTFSTENDARRLMAFLAVQAIECSVDNDGEEWVVWIHNDDDRDKATEYLNDYRRTPDQNCKQQGNGSQANQSGKGCRIST